MAHRRPLHALEKWAYDAASVIPETSVTKTDFIMSAGIKELSRRKNRRRAAITLQQLLTQIVFAADCIEGRAQIVRIPEELYDDVCKSELARTDKADVVQHKYLPWPMFAIELNHCKSQLAVVVSSFRYLQSRVKDAQRVLGIEDNAMEQVMDGFTELPDEEHDIIASLIPSPRTCEQGKRDLVDNLLKGLEGPITEEDLSPQELAVILVLQTMGTLPYPLWTKHVHNNDAPHPDAIQNLITFVMSDNAERTKVYEPPKEPQGKPGKKKKRKQCQAHIYEMGVSWSKAYKAYREAVKSGNHGGHKRPHIRRGHFHRFRVGPRDGEVRYVTYWLPPKLVGDTSKYKPSNQGHIIG